MKYELMSEEEIRQFDRDFEGQVTTRYPDGSTTTKYVKKSMPINNSHSTNQKGIGVPYYNIDFIIYYLCAQLCQQSASCIYCIAEL